jgi:hypothetical protein
MGIVWGLGFGTLSGSDGCGLRVHDGEPRQPAVANQGRGRVGELPGPQVDRELRAGVPVRPVRPGHPVRHRPGVNGPPPRPVGYAISDPRGGGRDRLGDPEAAHFKDAQETTRPPAVYFLRAGVLAPGGSVRRDRRLGLLLIRTEKTPSSLVRDRSIAPPAAPGVRRHPNSADEVFPF